MVCKVTLYKAGKVWDEEVIARLPRCKASSTR